MILIRPPHVLLKQTKPWMSNLIETNQIESRRVTSMSLYRHKIRNCWVVELFSSYSEKVIYEIIYFLLNKFWDQHIGDKNDFFNVSDLTFCLLSKQFKFGGNELDQTKHGTLNYAFLNRNNRTTYFRTHKNASCSLIHKPVSKGSCPCKISGESRISQTGKSNTNP